MYFIYNCVVYIAQFFIRIAAFFSPKLKLFVAGRKQVFAYLKQNISNTDNVVWVHVASLGEFEQGLPILEKIKQEYSNYKLLVTFFSPSGYEVKKNTSAADLVTYLPLDTKKNATAFIKYANPQLVLFVKYEIWPNYLKVLAAKQIPTILISALFKENHIYFKWYGGFMKNTLNTFEHFFIQDEKSKQLLSKINFQNTTVSGDTRFDRVSEILKRDNTIEFMTQFLGKSKCLVAGSTWPEDEKILVGYINNNQKDKLKYVIAPHNIKTEHIIHLRNTISGKTLLYSEIKDQNLSDYDVLIIDTIGLLTKIYSYAHISYVGGAFATGLHNTLEPAVFGIPVIIGSNYNGFKEAEDLVKLKGIISVNNEVEFIRILNRLLSDIQFHKVTGQINSNYITKSTGASIQIIDYLRKLL